MRIFEEAFQLMMRAARPTNSERVSLFECYGRVLREDVFSDVYMPPFNKSLMDGYACRRADLDMPLSVVEIIAAGRAPSTSLNEGTCAKIMTGAPLPEGADTVVMLENTRIENGRVIVTSKSDRTNICLEGEDVRRGDKVLSSGIRISAAEAALLASVGCDRPLVSCRPKVGVIATGSELVEPDVTPSSTQIRNSNGIQLWMQALSAGAQPVYHGIAEDDPNVMEESVRDALVKCDVLLLSGGICMGDFDFVPSVLETVGVNILFDKVKMKPGKTLVFGEYKDKYVFGLSGTPAGALAGFERMVRPFLAKIMGAEH